MIVSHLELASAKFEGFIEQIAYNKRRRKLYDIKLADKNCTIFAIGNWITFIIVSTRIMCYNFFVRLNIPKKSGVCLNK